jgi:FkbH-like protein
MARQVVPPDVVEAPGRDLPRAGDLPPTVAAQAVAPEPERPDPGVCLRLAREHERLGDEEEAVRWALAVTAAGDDFPAWQAAAGILARFPSAAPEPLRQARLAVLGSYTTSQLAPMVSLAARGLGVELELYECDYGQYRQEIVDDNSGLYGFAPDFVMIAVHDGELTLPEISSAPESDVAAEVERWTSLWALAAARTQATIVQTTFALPLENAMGHLAASSPGSRYHMARRLNLVLGEEASRSEHPILLLDCERLAGAIGTERWFDPRYWQLAKHAVSPPAMVVLARHAAALIAASLGLRKKCVVLDLDNTLWGGIIGEDGIAGIQLGSGVEGEAFAALQEYLLEVKRRGVALAVCSKNDEADARRPFREHPEMRLRLDDIAAFVADWRPKPEQLRTVAEALSIDLASLVLVDDSPAEREAVRHVLPEVDVVTLPDDPSFFVRALDRYLPLQPALLTDEDLRRTEQYRARARAAQLEASASSIEDFYRSLRMEALIAPFSEVDLPRIAQLVSKTNQFNLTTRRHGEARLRALAADPACVHLSLRLRDRLADHGLVGVMIALEAGGALDIDTWLMSCRVIGRSVETAMLNRLCAEAEARGLGRLRGTYVRTPRNDLVSDLYERLGFSAVERGRERSTWTYGIDGGRPADEFIDTESWTDSS